MGMAESTYTYEQYAVVSDAVGDAMEYAHDKAVELGSKADPLWNLDEYVNRIIEVVSPPDKRLKALLVDLYVEFVNAYGTPDDKREYRDRLGEVGVEV